MAEFALKSTMDSITKFVDKEEKKEGKKEGVDKKKRTENILNRI